MMFLPLLLLLSTASAHMRIYSPIPFNLPSFDNGPLQADGSNFPCKRDYSHPEARQKNVMRAGSTQTLAFIGSAVHGGGSCQIALTKDLKPTPSTKWQVIHSIHGGCPSNVSGNLPDDHFGHGAATFQYQIPKSFPSGDYTLSLTWFNRFGIREMYQDCAPITIKNGGKGGETFPDLFRANIGNGCTTVESQNVEFPTPGKSLSTLADTIRAVGSCPAVGFSSNGKGGGSVEPSETQTKPKPTQTKTKPTQTKTKSTQTKEKPTNTKTKPKPTQTSTKLPPKSCPATKPTTKPTTSKASVPTKPPKPSNGKKLSGSCTTEGYFNCLGTTFQRCASGLWSEEMLTAAGTKCVVEGAKADIQILASNTRHRKRKWGF